MIQRCSFVPVLMQRIDHGPADQALGASDDDAIEAGRAVGKLVKLLEFAGHQPF